MCGLGGNLLFPSFLLAVKDFGMIKRKLTIGTLLILAAATGGCSVIPQVPPSEAATRQYGPYCEQLGNVKGTPEYEKCIKNLEDTYR
jgi:hypothetical protein